MLEPSKCKTLTIGKIYNYNDTNLNGIDLEDIQKGKILGHIFNRENNNIDHIGKKGDETINMMAAFGRNIKDNNLDKMYMSSIVILYKKCIITKLLYGMIGFSINEKEMEKIGGEKLDDRRM